jgi:putative membrane protein
MMTRFLLRWAINAVALYAAVALVPGIRPQSENWLAIIWLALIFGVVNAFLGPLLKFLTCPLILLTLGLFTLIINAFLFYLAGMIGTAFGVGFTVDNFWAALLGSIVVSLVSVVLSLVVKDELKK